MTNIKNKKTAWIEFTIQAAFLREILHSLNHPPADNYSQKGYRK